MEHVCHLPGSLCCLALDLSFIHICAKGCADFLIGDYAAKHTISEGDMLVGPSKTLCGVTTETGCIYTEIIIKKENNNMNKMIKSGEVMKLKDLISYEMCIRDSPQA